MKKIVVMFLMMMMMVGCASTTEHGEIHKREIEKLEGPYVLTSFGQSADVVMMKSIFNKLEKEVIYKPTLEFHELEENTTLFIAVGASTKGIEAAGISVEDELERSEAFSKMTKEQNITVVPFHFGGTERRGKISDDFITLACHIADVIVIVETGNEDGFFTNLASEQEAMLIELESIRDVTEQIKVLIE